MKIKKLLLVYLVLSAVSVRAAEISDIVRQIAEAQGMRSLVDDLLASAKANAEAVMKRTLAEMGARSGAFNEAQQKKVDAAGMHFHQSLFEALDAEKYVSVWVDEYSKHVTEPQAQAILAYYRSDAGKIDVAASKRSAVETQKYFQHLVAEKLRPGAASYVDEIKKIVSSPE